MNTFEELIEKLKQDSKLHDLKTYPIKQRNKWGFSDNQKNILLPCEHEEVRPFKDGLAAVKQDNQWNFINREGKRLSLIEFEDVGDFHQGIAWVIQKGLVGYINFLGKIVIECKYSTRSRDCCEGLVAVEYNSKYAYFNNVGHQITPFEFDLADDFSEGLAAVSKDYMCGFINKYGTLVLPFEFEFDISEYNRKFKDGIAAIRKNKKWGHINSKGETVTPFIYDFAHPFSEGLARVEKNNMEGIINLRGDVVIPFGKYLYPNSMGWRVPYFTEGLLPIKSNNSKVGYIDLQGTIKIQPQYNEAGSFRDKLAIVEKDYKCCIIDKTGKELFTYDLIFPQRHYDKFYVIHNRNNFYVDVNGTEYYTP